jgi:hypothetical protein
VPAGWGAGHLGDTGHAKWPAAFMATPEGKAAFARAAAADRAGAAAGAAKYGPGRMGTYSEGEPLSVQGGTGTAGGRDATTTVKGSANLNIKLDGFPFGTKTSTSTTGDLFGAPLIEQAMPLGHGP